MIENDLTETVTTATSIAGNGLHSPEGIVRDDDRVGIISIPAKTVANLLGIGTDVRTELIDVLAWDQELTWGADLEKVKRSVPIGDFKVISQDFHFESQSYRLLVHHPSLPPVSPGSLIPALEVECRTSNPDTLIT